jgi:hypothetical protein
MAVPYTFGTATAAIPLSQLDSNFATAITIGNTAVQLGNTVTTLNNMTLANVTISSGTVTLTNVAVTTANVSGTANISTLVVVGNETVGGNTTITGNITAANANVTTSLVLSGGTANGVAYLNGSKVLTTGTALAFNGSKLGIGTTSFDAPLQVQAITGGTSMRFNGRASPNDSYSDISFYNNANTTQVAGIGAANSGLFLATAIASPITFTTNNAEVGRFDSSGNLLVGTTSAGGYKFNVTAGASYAAILACTSGNVPLTCQITSGSGSQTYAYFYNGATLTGTITTTGTNTSYNSISDYRLKENIAPMTSALDVVKQLKPVTYKWKIDGTDGQGFIAHELQAVVPECVTGEKDAVDENGNPKYQGIDTSFLVATLTAAIKEQSALITTLTDRITALEAR